MTVAGRAATSSNPGRAPSSWWDRTAAGHVGGNHFLWAPLQRAGPAEACLSLRAGDASSKTAEDDPAAASDGSATAVGSRRDERTANKSRQLSLIRLSRNREALRCFRVAWRARLPIWPLLEGIRRGLEA